MNIFKDGFTFYQVLILTVSLANILIGITKLLNKKKTLRELVVLTIFWIFFSLLALYPHLSGFFAEITGFELGINALLVGASIILFFNMLKQSQKNEEFENTMTKLVREIALRDLSK